MISQTAYVQRDPTHGQCLLQTVLLRAPRQNGDASSDVPGVDDLCRLNLVLCCKLDDSGVVTALRPRCQRSVSRKAQ